MSRALAVLAAFAAVLLLSGCVAVPARGDAHPRRLPLGVSEQTVAYCERSVGLGSSTRTTSIWRDGFGVHARIGVGLQHVLATSAVRSATEQALISCLTVASGEPYPSDSAALLLLWKYSASVLWPCFARHGVDAGPVPSRAVFLAGDPLQIDPYDLVVSPVSDSVRQTLRRDCPALPDYLRPAAESGSAAGSGTGSGG